MTGVALLPEKVLTCYGSLAPDHSINYYCKAVMNYSTIYYCNTKARLGTDLIPCVSKSGFSINTKRFDETKIQLLNHFEISGFIYFSYHSCRYVNKIFHKSRRKISWLIIHLILLYNGTNILLHDIFITEKIISKVKQINDL